jgi:hypothetical protein
MPDLLRQLSIQAADKAVIGLALARGYVNRKMQTYKGV